MRSLQRHHITSLYVVIDDYLATAPRTARTGRPPVLRDSEVLTILIWNGLTVRQKLLKDIYAWVEREYAGEFPRLPAYQNFVAHCHRLLPRLYEVLEQSLCSAAPVRFMDSTKLDVCRLERASDHRTARSAAAFGRNRQGWWYGFKLHASIDAVGRLCQVALTPANAHDAQTMPLILNRSTDIAVGDAGYTASVMKRKIWRAYGCLVVSPPHYKQRRFLLARWQQEIYRLRPKVESMFDYLKEHMQIVTSFARSVNGYLLHYLRVLLSYQFMVS